MMSTFSGQGPAHLRFSFSSTNSRFHNFLSGNMLITPPAPPTPRAARGLAGAQAAPFKCRIRNADVGMGPHL